MDARGIYIAADIVDVLWAFEKAPLVADPPSVGRVFSWLPQACQPSSPLERVNSVLHPAHTYGDPGGEYLIQQKDGDELDIYKISGLFDPTCPTLTLMGSLNVPLATTPASAPALGSQVNIDTLNGSRLMMAVFRGQSLWTCHTVGGGAGAACRWYEINPETLTLVQSGTVADPSLFYYYPSLMVNTNGDVIMGFSGSNASQYVAAYFTGRRSCDPAGTMRAPQLLKLGEASYQNLLGPINRWGDYTYTTLDSSDELTFWTIQEYAESHTQRGQEEIHNWGTWVGQVSFNPFDCDADGTSDADAIAACLPADCDCNDNGKPDSCETDCDNNGTADTCDIALATTLDCNSNGVLDACDITGGTSCNLGGIPSECVFRDCDRDCTSDAQEIIGGAPDCNDNGTPDSCEGTDCNENGLFDACDIAVGTSNDCDDNLVPDECQSDCDSDGTPDSCEPDCNATCLPDACDLIGGTSLDCNGNGTPDECDPDCNVNGFPDDCDLTFGTSLDCEANGTPDDCEPGYCEDLLHACGVDCNFNDAPDSADIASGISQDSNANGTPDECDGSRPIACVTAVSSRKLHTGQGFEDIAVNLNGHVDNPGTLTSEMRQAGISELRIAFDAVLTNSGPDPATIFEQSRESCVTTCPGGTQRAYEPYDGASIITSSLDGSGTTLILNFSPGLENAVTYKIRINTTITRVASQTFEIRGLKADVNGDGKVNATDRSLVIAEWTGPNPPPYSKETDINLDGATNGADRSIVIGAWTNPTTNCAP